MNLGIAKAVKDPSMDPGFQGKQRQHLEAAGDGAFELGQPLSWPGDVIGLQIWPLKAAAPCFFFMVFNSCSTQCPFVPMVIDSFWSVVGSCLV